MTPRFPMKKNINLMLRCFLLAVFLLANSVAHAELNLELPKRDLPDLVNTAIPVMGYTQERKIGLKVLRKLRSQGSIIEDPEITSWIQSLGNRLAMRAAPTGNPYYFLVSKSRSVNAFATMGGVIVVNAGLILKTASESELAAVISHEIAHVTQRHIERMINHSKQNVLGRSAAILAGVVAGSKNPQLGSAIITTTMATAMHKQLSFSREAESEADRVGLKILASAGYNPQGMPLFLQKLEQLSDSRFSEVSEYLQSHPLAHKRVLDAQLRANNLRAFQSKEHVDYLYMREKIRTLTKAPATVKLSPKIKQYAHALQLKQNGNFSRALQIAQGFNGQIYAASLQANLLNQQKKYAKTIQLLKPLLASYPNHIALSIPLARATLALGQAQQAWNIIQNIPLREQTSLEFLEVRQQIAHASKHDAEAYRSVAERNIRIGEYKYAAIQLRQAMKQRDINAAQRILFQKLLADVESKIKTHGNDARTRHYQ